MGWAQGTKMAADDRLLPPCSFFFLGSQTVSLGAQYGLLAVLFSFFPLSSFILPASIRLGISPVSSVTPVPRFHHGCLFPQMGLCFVPTAVRWQVVVGGGGENQGGGEAFVLEIIRKGRRTTQRDTERGVEMASRLLASRDATLSCCYGP